MPASLSNALLIAVRAAFDALPGRLRAIGGWRLACVALAGVYLLSLATRGSTSYSVAWDGGFYTAAYLACAFCCWTRARRAGGSAAVWRLFAIGIASYATGWATVAHWLVHLQVQPIPSIADIGWLGLYPPALIAIFRIMNRVRTYRAWSPAMLDSLLAGLGTAAICAWVVFPEITLTASGQSWLVTATAAAYPFADLLLVGAVTATLVAARFDVTRTIWLLLGAVLMLTGADCVYLTGIAGGSFAWGTWVNGVWLVALVVIALCSGTPFAARTAVGRRSWLVQGVPAISTLSSLFILVVYNDGPGAFVIDALCAASIVVAVLRLTLTFQEAEALADSRELAHTDELTGMVNRRGFQERGAAALDSATGPLAVLLVDLDGFKDINDGLGHPTGDELLRALGRRLIHETKGVAVVARIGGDEFAVIADDSDGGAVAVAERVLTSIRRPFELQGIELRVDASIGIASSPGDGTSLQELLRHADVAMYQAKAGRRGVQRYAAKVEENRDALRVIAQLRYALESDPGQLVLHYQPKIHLVTGRLAGLEALVRWQHPERGLLMPDQFLPMVEKARLMPLLTDRVLEQALAQTTQWSGDLRGLPVAVNLPAEAVTDPLLVDRVVAMLRATGTKAHELQLEITEDFLMADLAGARVILERLRLLGIKISIDDYGTGYSSLAYLRDLPVDELKLDRAFIEPILKNKRAASIVRSTIDLAHSLGLVMVAEGIEDEDTWHRLLAMGCDIGQGYFFGRPQLPVDLEKSVSTLFGTRATATGDSRPWALQQSLPADGEAPVTPLRSTG